MLEVRETVKGSREATLEASSIELELGDRGTRTKNVTPRGTTGVITLPIREFGRVRDIGEKVKEDIKV